MKLRPEVRWFAQEMERQLRANDHKGGWQEMSPFVLGRRLLEEYEELLSACLAAQRTPDRLPFHSSVLEEAADVANFAMMIADVSRLPKKVTP